MSSIRRVEVIKWQTTPNKLRAIAAALDAKWNAAMVGQDVPKHIVDGPLGTELHIIIDQEEKYDEERREKQR